MSPGDVVKVAGVISVRDVVSSGSGCNGGGCLATVVQMGLVEDVGLSSSSRCRVVGVHLVTHPLCVAQESGFQSRVQGKERLDQWGLRL